MKASITYDTLKEYGTSYEETYTVKISSSPGYVRVDFIFYKDFISETKKKLVREANLLLTFEEAENLAGALNAFLHHPTDNGRAVKTVIK